MSYPAALPPLCLALAAALAMLVLGAASYRARRWVGGRRTVQSSASPSSENLSGAPWGFDPRFADQIPVSLTITDLQGRIRHVNRKVTKITGYMESELVGQPFSSLEAGERGEDDYRSLWQTVAAGDTWRGELQQRKKSGETLWEAATVSPLRDAEGAVTHFVAVQEDITERKRAEEQLNLGRAVFDTITEGIMVTDAQANIKAVNPAFSLITGYAPEEVIGRNPGLLSSGRHDASFFAAMRTELQQRGHWEGEIWNRKRSGDLFPAWLSISAVPDGEGRIKEYVAACTDISERKNNEQRILHQASFDPLTSLPNRSLLYDRLNRAVASARRENSVFAVLFIDLDRFKAVNDSLGHAYGDQVLLLAAQRLTETVRESDTVARFGGDEFAIVLEHISKPADAAEVGKKIVARIGEAFTVDGREIYLGASIGIALFPADSEDAGTLLSNADMAMYLAKESGRNTFRFFTPNINEQVRLRVELEVDLRQAMTDGQFSLLYQPIVELHSGRVVALEALLRWHHPQRGWVSPDEFIPMAEDRGLIAELGNWVLETACRQVCNWTQPELSEIGVSVNISNRQRKLGLSAERLRRVLDATGLPGHRLTLEITEGIVLDDTEEAIAWLETLRCLGVNLSIDDFGTGYSSLSYLKRFPVNALKIDRSFISELTENPEDASLVQAIIAMAHSLGLHVIAEGVETREQYLFLRALHCSCAQGFYFSAPLPAGEVPELMQKGLSLQA